MIIPTYDRAEVLPRAIQSVLAQTYDNFELIIVDDASTDDTAAVVKQFDDNRIQYHCFDENKGANAARNKGIMLANSQYLSFLDSDDEFKPTYIQKVVSAFDETNNKCVCVFTSFASFESGKLVGVSVAKNGYVTPDEILSDNIVGGFSCVTFRSIVFDTVGQLDEDLQSQQDYDYFVRITKQNFYIFGINDELVICHKNSSDRISDSLSNKLKGSERILAKHGDVLNNKGASRLYYYSAFGYAKQGDMQSAKKYFKKSIKANPKRWLAYIHFVAALNTLTFKLLIFTKKKMNRMISLF